MQFDQCVLRMVEFSALRNELRRLANKAHSCANIKAKQK